MKPAKQEAQDCPPETARARRRSTTVRLSRKVKLVYTWRARRRLPALLLRMLTQAFAWLLAGWSSHAVAAPEGGNVVSGSASISKPSSSQTLIKQSSARAAIDWNSYSVGAGERVTYQQPTSSSVTLNRVTGGDLSRIYGSIDANGVVVISNPAGIYFGQGAQVNVGGLVASAMAISNADFNAGNYRFQGSGGGSVRNEGSIQAGSYGVALIGHTVDNSGRIESGGAVILGAGGQATLKLANDRLVDVAIDASSVQAQVSNQGVIHADGNQILLSARATDALLDTVLYAGGKMRADSLREVNGKIVLDGGSSGVVKVDGTVQARGLNAEEKGGLVTVTGERVMLASNSLIDASGQSGGGQVHVGGGYQGRDPAIAHATDVVMQAGAAIRADATAHGDGGEAVLWSDHGTVFAGEISARGGPEGGDGGLVETSGTYLQAYGQVHAFAPKGKAGKWLLDPFNITIGNGDTSGADANFTAIDNSAFVNAVNISNALTLGTAVTVSTGQGGTQAGNITVLSHLDSNASSGTSLTLEAAGDIFMDTGSRIRSVNAPLDVALHAGGNIAMNSGASILTGGGNLQATGNNIQMALVRTEGGNVSVTAGGEVVMTDIATDHSLSASTGQRGGSVSVAGQLVDLADVFSDGGDISVTAGGLAYLNGLTTPNRRDGGVGTLNVNAQTLALGSIDAGDINLAASSELTQSGRIIAQGVTTVTSPANVWLGHDQNDFRGRLTINQAHDIEITNIGALQLDGSIGGDLKVKTNGPILQFNAISVQGKTTLDAGSANNIELPVAANSFVGPVTIQSAKDVTVFNNRDLAIDGQVSGNLDLRSEGISQVKPLTVAGSTSLTTGAGKDIVLEQDGNGFTGPVTIQSARNASVKTEGDLQVAGTVGSDLHTRAAGSTTFDNLTVGGALDALSAGFTQTGGVSVFGDAVLDGATTNPFDASLGNSNFVLHLANDLRGTVTLRHAENVVLNNAGPLKLAGAVNGNLTVGSSGITQGEVLSVNGDMLLNTGTTGDINLSTPDNDFRGRVAVQSARNVSLASKDLQLDGTISGDLDATATAGSLTQFDALDVAGNSRLAARDDIVLGNAGNHFGGTVDLKTTNGGASLAAGNLKLTADVANGLQLDLSGILLQGPGPIVVNGDTTIQADGVFPDEAGNVFNGTLNVIAQDALVAGQVTGDLNLFAHRIVNQSVYPLTVTGKTSLKQEDPAGGVFLDHGDNSFGGPVTLDIDGAANIISKDNLQLEGRVAGSLRVDVGEGSLTQSGALDVGGTSNFSVADHILLRNSANRFGGSMVLQTNTGVAALHSNGDLTVRGQFANGLEIETTGELKQGSGMIAVYSGDTILNAAAIDVSGTNNGFAGNLFLTSQGAAAVAGVVAGDLEVSAKGDISQGTQALKVDGQTRLTVESGSTGSIRLDRPDNLFADMVHVDSTGDTIIGSGGDLRLEGNTAGMLKLDVAGAIGQGRALSAGTVLLSTHGPGQHITLDHGGNVFSGTVTLDGAGDVTLANAGALKVEGQTAGNLNLATAGAPITQGDALKVGGSTTLAAGSGDITLDHSANELSGVVSVLSARNATLNSKALQLEGVFSGTLNATANAGSLTQSGLLDVSGTGTLAARDDILLQNAANRFGSALDLQTGSGQARLQGNGDLTLTVNVANGLDIHASGALTQGGDRIKVTSGATTLEAARIDISGANNDFGGALTLMSEGAAALAGHVGGKLEVNAKGDITQGSQALNVDGQTNLAVQSASPASIVLEHAANHFTGRVSFSSPGDTTIVSGGALQLEGSAAGMLKVDSAGAVTQSDAVFADGAQLITRGVDQAIVLADPGNALSGTVEFHGSGEVSLFNTTQLDVKGESAGKLSLATSAGSITQSGMLSAGGASLVTQGAGDHILLDLVPNAFSGAVSFSSAGDVRLASAGDITVSGAAGRDLTIQSASIIRQGDAALSIGRNASLIAGGDITLDNMANAFGQKLAFSSPGAVQLGGGSDLTLEGSAHTLDVAAAASIAQSGSLAASGASSFSAQGANADLILEHPDNMLMGPVSFSATRKVSLFNNGDLEVAGSAGQDLALQSAGALTQTSGKTLSAGGATRMAAPEGIDAAGEGNTFGGVLRIDSAGDVRLASAGALQLEGQARGLAVSAAGSITQGDNALRSQGPAFFTSTGAGHDIVLTRSDNEFQGPVRLDSAGQADIVNSTDLRLGGEVMGNLNATANNASILQGDPVIVHGDAVLTTTRLPESQQATDIILDGNHNIFYGQLTINSAGRAVVHGQGQLAVSGSVADTLDLAVLGGSIVQGSAALNVGAASTLSTFGAENGQPTDIRLDDGSNNFGGPVILNSAGDAALAAAGNLLVNGSVTGRLELQAAGNIGQDAALEVGGGTQLAAGGQIDLGHSDNDFKDSVTVVHAGQVTIADRNDLQSAGQTSGQLELVAGGSLTQSGAWQVDGASLLSAGSSVQFDDAGNQLSGPLQLASGQDSHVSNNAPVSINASIGGDLTVAAPTAMIGGSVGGSLNVVGNAFLQPMLVVGGSNGPMSHARAIERALAASFAFLSDERPGSYRNFLLLANPPLRPQGSLLPVIEGSGIRLPEDGAGNVQSARQSGQPGNQ